MPSTTPEFGPVIETDDGSERFFLCSTFSPEDAASERGLLLSEAVIREAWFTARWTTPAELDDEDALHAIFTDPEVFDTSVVVSEVPPRTPGSAMYYGVRERPEEAPDA